MENTGSVFVVQSEISLHYTHSETNIGPVGLWIIFIAAEKLTDVPGCSSVSKSDGKYEIKACQEPTGGSGRVVTKQENQTRKNETKQSANN